MNIWEERWTIAQRALNKIDDYLEYRSKIPQRDIDYIHGIFAQYTQRLQEIGDKATKANNAAP